jgi:hypothetical protein
MSQPNAPLNVDTAFAEHFSRFAAATGSHCLVAASETETSPREIRRFAEYRFSFLVRAFEGSFYDAWDAIGEPFRRAALNGLAGRRGER